MIHRSCRKCLCLSIIILTGVVFVGCGKGSGPSRRTSEEKGKVWSDTGSTAYAEDPVVATVGNLKIRYSEVLDLSRDREKNATVVRPEDTLTEVRKRIRLQQLEGMIDRRLMVLDALKHPEWVTDVSCEQEVQHRLSVMGTKGVEKRKRQAGFETTDEFLHYFRRYVREELMKAALIRHEVEDRLSVSDVEIQERYEKDREEVYHRPDSWKVYHITQYLPRDREQDLPNLLEELEKLRFEVARAIEDEDSPERKAEKMLPFVRRHAKGKGSESGVAFLYDTPKVKFDPEFVNRVKSAVIGDLSPVFRLAGDEKRVGAGFFLVAEYQQGEYAPLDRVRDEVREKILEEKRDHFLKDLSERLRNEFPVVIHEDLLYKDLQEAPTEEASS